VRVHLSRAFFADYLERGREQGAILRQSFIPRRYACHFGNTSKSLSLATRKFSEIGGDFFLVHGVLFLSVRKRPSTGEGRVSGHDNEVGGPA
jgi:hypothetical protein